MTPGATTSPNSKARTGHWSGRVREQGPVIRRRGKLYETETVLDDLEKGCATPRLATHPVRDALFGEDWKTVHLHLGQGRSKHSNWKWDTAFEEFANASWQLNRVCHRRQSRPVWAETPTKLAVITNIPNQLDPWIQGLLLARRWPLDGRTIRTLGRQTHPVPIAVMLGVIALFADATIDDVAQLCNTSRDDIYRRVWKEPEPTM